MTYHTHLVGALAFAAAFAAGRPLPAAAVLLAAAVVAAPLPDLDHPGSTYGRFVPLPRVARRDGAVVPYRRGGRSVGHVGFRLPCGILWHRGPLHSLTAGFAAVALATEAGLHWWPAYASVLALGVAIAWLSHLPLEGLTVAGQAWLWPFTARKFRLPGWPVRVGTWGETAVLVTCGLGLRWAGHGLIARLPF